MLTINEEKINLYINIITQNWQFMLKFSCVYSVMIRISVKYTLCPRDTLWLNCKIIRHFEKIRWCLNYILRILDGMLKIFCEIQMVCQENFEIQMLYQRYCMFSCDGDMIDLQGMSTEYLKKVYEIVYVFCEYAQKNFIF